MNSVGDLFSGLSNSLLRFVYAWFVPAVTVVVAAAAILYPPLAHKFRLAPISGVGSVVTAGFVGLFAVFVLSVLFALSSLPIYRLLEGYTIPAAIARPLRRRQVRRWMTLRAVAGSSAIERNRRNAAIEKLNDYPCERELIMPTRLGNGLKALETYALSHYGVDSQLLWYEFTSLAPEGLRGDVEDARMPIDFFISFSVYLSGLSIASLVTAVLTSSSRAAMLGLAAAALVPLSYRSAVRSLGELRLAVQALVNISRCDVIRAFGLTVPNTAEGEVRLWKRLTKFTEPGGPEKQIELRRLNQFRHDQSPSSSSTAASP